MSHENELDHLYQTRERYARRWNMPAEELVLYEDAGYGIREVPKEEYGKGPPLCFRWFDRPGLCEFLKKEFPNMPTGAELWRDMQIIMPRGCMEAGE